MSAEREKQVIERGLWAHEHVTAFPQESRITFQRTFSPASPLNPIPAFISVPSQPPCL